MLILSHRQRALEPPNHEETDHAPIGLAGHGATITHIAP